LKPVGAAGYGIPSGAALKVYPDGKVEALGGVVVQYVHQAQGVIKGKDLLP